MLLFSPIKNFHFLVFYFVNAVFSLLLDDDSSIDDGNGTLLGI